MLHADDPHIRPNGVSDETIAALGKMSEALEWVERARGHLYEFHQLIGHADLTMDEAVEAFEKAGHPTQAAVIGKKAIGRNVLPGRWTFQIVEEFDDGYYENIKNVEKDIRMQLVQGKRHIYESEMKEQRRSKHEPGHESRP